MEAPDYWVVVKFTHPQLGETHKVLMGWQGSYLGSESWQLNSGIVDQLDGGSYWDFYGASGSCYRCYKNRHGLSGLTHSVLEKFKKTDEDLTVEVMEHDWKL
jgi:hypothetical protein